jgi:predicted nuclease of predicted toxin-antitoxin system
VKLLLDQGLPRGAVAELGRRGFDAVHAADIAMAAATDSELLEYAHREARTLVTLDADVHALLAVSGAASPSVIRLRIEGLRAAPLADLLERVVSVCRGDLAAGAMVTVEEHSVRVRMLPIVR